jgi:hypothetical protein
MSEDTRKIVKKRERSESGVMPMPVLEPLEKRESPALTTLPEMLDEDKLRTPGIMPVVKAEGVDISAERESDPATRN